MGGHYISLSVTTATVSQFQKAWTWMNNRASELGGLNLYPGVTVSSTLMDTAEVELDADGLYYDENTILKVRSAIVKAVENEYAMGRDPNVAADNIINALLNRGILFRERTKES